VDSFEEFQAMIALSSKIFQRPALMDLYAFFTSSNSAKTSFMKPNLISSHDRRQTCLAIQKGATAAIRSVRQEFEREVDIDSTREYLNILQAGENITQLLISIKGTHHPLNASVVPNSAKGASLIRIVCLYT
jgi:hypothetical protein